MDIITQAFLVAGCCFFLCTAQGKLIEGAPILKWPTVIILWLLAFVGFVMAGWAMVVIVIRVIKTIAGTA